MTHICTTSESFNMKVDFTGSGHAAGVTVFGEDLMCGAVAHDQRADLDVTDHD